MIRNDDKLTGKQHETATHSVQVWNPERKLRDTSRYTQEGSELLVIVVLLLLLGGSRRVFVLGFVLGFLLEGRFCFLHFYWGWRRGENVAARRWRHDVITNHSIHVTAGPAGNHSSHPKFCNSSSPPAAARVISKPRVACHSPPLTSVSCPLAPSLNDAHIDRHDL